MSSTTIDDFQTAVLNAVRAHFGSLLAQSGLYDPSDELDDSLQAELKTPCILIGIEGLALADDGEELPDPESRVPYLADCYAECWLSRSTETMPRRLPEYAAAMIALVQAPRTVDSNRRGNRWGLGNAVSWPEDVTAEPGDANALHGRYAWLVRWQQRIYTDGALPT